MSYRDPLFTFLAAAILPATGVPAAGAQEKKEKMNLIVGRVKSELKDTSKPFTMMIIVTVKDGSADKFEAAVNKATPAAIKDRGCKEYTLYRNTQSPNRFVVFEQWENLDGLQAHTESKHIRGLLDEVRELMAAPPEIRVLTSPAGE